MRRPCVSWLGLTARDVESRAWSAAGNARTCARSELHALGTLLQRRPVLKSDRLRRRKRHPTASQSDAPIPVARVGPSEEAPFPDVIGAALDAFTGERFTDFPHLLLPPCFPEPTRGLRSTRASGQLTGFTEQFGAGEGIRTLDPDLGKVVPSVCTRLLAFAHRCISVDNPSFLVAGRCNHLRRFALSC